jgi:transitional endoplasmic reticulum ATPase
MSGSGGSGDVDDEESGDGAGGAVELAVRETSPRDAGRGIVRLPEAARRALGVLSGDTVRIEGSTATVAKVWPAGSDLGDAELRMDGETRSNAGVRIGDRVQVRPRRVEDAERVVLTPTDSADLGVDAGTVGPAVGRSLRGRPVAPGEVVRVEALGSTREFHVARTVPDGTVLVREETTVDVDAGTTPVGTSGASDGSGAGDGSEADPGADESGRRVGITYEDIGGLGDELEQVRELVELPLSNPDLFRRLGIDPPKGVLLHGPPGTGKTLIARAVANEVDAHFVSVSGPEVMGKYKGESEERIREVFEEARENAPTVIFFDEIDSIAGRREDDADMESRVVAQLLSLLDGLEARGEVIVIGATNRVDALDPALRRPGRFDREIEVGVPGRAGRREILDIHTRGVPLADDVDLDRLAERTHGFTGADLEALVTEAAMAALRRLQADEDAATVVTRGDLETAVGSAEPSAMREFVVELPETGFEAVGGLEEQKTVLRETIEWPLAYGNLFEATRTDPPTGILLHGPPGTGKTLLARAIANESGVNLIRVAGPELVDKYVGESERAVREVFERARQTAPCIVFFDEIDAIAGERGRGGDDVGERVVSQLLTELDGAAANPALTVLAATNRKDALDRALLRPGRLERHLRVPPPDEAARRTVLDVHVAEKPLAADVDLDALAAETEGYTGADLEALVREASMRAIREAAAEKGVERADAEAGDIRVGAAHFRAAMAVIDPESGSGTGDARAGR